MNIRFLLRVFLVVIFVQAQPSFGEVNVNKPLQEAVTKSFPGFEAHIADEKDGLVAAILIRPIEDAFEHDLKVAIFERLGQTYQLITASKGWRYYLGHRQGWSIEIKGQSIILYFGGSASCCSGFDTELRFKKINESFQLVGEETWSHGIESTGSDNKKYYESRTSINYLTGKVIHYRISGVRRDCRENESAVKGRITRQCFDGAPRSKEIELSFPASKLELSAFQPDRYWSYKKKAPQLCGYINQRMKYEPCK